MTGNPLYKTPQGEQSVMVFYQRILADWPLPNETRTLSTSYGDTFVLVCGDPSAPPLVLLHGSTSNAAAWAGDAAAYGRHRRVYVVDIPGEPGKSAPNRMAWDGPGPVDWLTQVFDGLGLEKADVAGMSLGAWLALTFAAARPERVRRLVLIAPGGLAPARVSFLLRAVFWSLFGRRGARRINRIVCGDQPLTPEVDEFAYLVSKHFKVRTDSLPILSDETLQRVTAPVYLFVGAKDALLDSQASVARLRANLPDLRYRLFPDGPHALLNLTGDSLPFLTEAD